jgi:glycosyltransferase involved in cell wall biosynthesis
MKLLALVTDAYGGRGGIAKFNRDLLSALCSHRACEKVVALPRVIVEDQGVLPKRLSYLSDSAGGKARYVARLARVATREKFAGIVCGHLNLLPLAALVARYQRAPLLQIVHGVEAWPRGSGIRRIAVRRVDFVVSVSEFTQQRFLAWSGLPESRGQVVPNCIDATLYGVGPKRPDLVERYGIEGRTVLLTLGRLSAAERYKGIDEVLEVIPTLVASIPSLSYLIAGEGDDRPRLEAKALSLGIADRVVFTGYVSEHEKADHYRLADAFVMPGRGEGFGIVYLEALACGVPVVASAADASHEVVAGEAAGFIAHPDRPAQIAEAIRLAVARTERTTPPRLAEFSVDAFEKRWHLVIDRAFGFHGQDATTLTTDRGETAVTHHSARIPC